MSRDKNLKISDWYYTYRWLPPVLVLVIVLMFHRIDALQQYDLFRHNEFIDITIGIVIWFYSIFLRVWSRSHIGEHSRSNTIESPTLVKTGPYAISRNPLYLSNILAGVGIASFKCLTAALIALVLMTIHYLILAYFEKRHLNMKFSKEYQEWSKNTSLIWINPTKIITEERRSDFKISTMLAKFLDDIWTWVWQLIAVLLIIGV